jgi:putative ABC transport system ATP-binding protein
MTPTAPPATLYAAYAEDLVKVYGSGDVEVRAVDGVSVGFDQGRFTAIMGPSGAGKSTLLSCVAGLEPLTAGKVCLGETDLTGLDEDSLTLVRRDRVGFVFQQFNLVPTLTAAENITLPLCFADREVDEALLAMLVDALGLRDRLGHLPRDLSGGQQQRVAVARALVTRPELICADEPTGALDQQTGEDLLALLRKAVDTFGQTVVMVTHDPFAAAVADRVLYLRDGRVVADAGAPTADAVMRQMRDLRDAG